jgi:PAS domain S-box-containing protein
MSRERKPLEERSKEELARELEKLQIAMRRFETTADEPDRERLVHDLQVHQVELEMETRELREAQQRLEEVTSRYADLYDFAPVGYCTIDLKGRIREINLTAAALLEGTRADIVGHVFTSVAKLESRLPFLEHLQRCSARDEHVTSEIVLVTAAGGSRTLQLVSDPVHAENGETTGYRTILVDVSHLKALENRLRLLADAGEKLASSLDYLAVIETTARSLVPALADICMIDVVSASGSIERPMVLCADPAQQKRLGERMRNVRSRTGWETAQSRVIASGESLFLAELLPEGRSRVADEDPQVDLARVAGIRSLMVVPLAARSRILGAITLATAESERRFSPADLRLAQDVANRAAMAVDNSRLFDDAQGAIGMMRLAEAKASGIVAISADAIISVDEAQRITLWNDGAEKIYGYHRAEALGTPLEILIPEAMRDAHRRDMASFVAGSEVARRMGERPAMLVGLRKNGEEFPADASISKLRVGDQQILTVAVRDVTEQKRIEGEQRFIAEIGAVLESSLDYEDTLKHVTRAIARDFADFCVLYIVDDEGQLRRASAASHDSARAWFTELLLQIPVDAAPQHVARQIVATRKSILGEVTAEMLPLLAHDEQHLRALHEVHLRSLIGVPLAAGDRCFGALLFEASARLYSPADLQLAEEIGRRTALLIENARLHRSARVAIQARDDVLRIVAHDLRNPLLAILVEADVLRSAEPHREFSAADSANLIQRSATRMNRLIEDLLDAMRAESGVLGVERKSVSVADIVADFVELQRPIASSRSLDLRTDLASDLGEVIADRDRLLQVLENLVANAERLTEPGGRITVGAAPAEGAVVFWVADTGPGIEPEEIAHVFDHFGRAPRGDRRGSGLGLPIVKGIVEAHGGRVWAESRRGAKGGGGSTFFFTMPRASTGSVKRRIDFPLRAESGESATP